MTDKPAETAVDEVKADPRVDLAQELVVVCVLTIVGVILAASPLTGLSYWSVEEPGSGFLPLWTGIALLLTASINLLNALRDYRKTASDAANGAWQHWHLLRRLGLFVLLLLAATILIPVVGTLLSLSAFTALELRLVERVRWLPSLAAAVLLAVSTYYIFEIALDVRLP
jgi:hypothetical protein